MSKLILDKLKTIKPLFKAKGLNCEQYGIVQDKTLYFNNGVICVKLPIDIPFDCAVHLHQLYTVLQSIKGESVIVYQNEILTVKSEDVTYTINSVPLEFYLELDYSKFSPTVDCSVEKPFIFNQMMKLAELYVMPITNMENIQYGFETVLIHNGSVLVSDRKRIIQGLLDYGMPTLAFALPTILAYNKLADDVIVSMGLENNMLAVGFDNGLVVYLPSCLTHNDKADYFHNLIIRTLDKNWEQPDIVIPDFVKKQILLLNKLNSNNVVFFNNSFCESNGDRIEYKQFTDVNFNARLLYKYAKQLFENDFAIKVKDKSLISFLGFQNKIRGVMGMVQEND